MKARLENYGTRKKVEAINILFGIIIPTPSCYRLKKYFFKRSIIFTRIP